MKTRRTWLTLFLCAAMLICALLINGCTTAPSEAQPVELSSDDGEFWRTEWQERAAHLYTQNCATCHGDEGEGIAPYFPALLDSSLVTGPIGGVIILPMYGRGAMPSFSSILSDEEIALVLSHIRTAWGNNAGAISPEQVSPFRQEGIDVPLEPILGGDA